MSVLPSTIVEELVRVGYRPCDPGRNMKVLLLRPPTGVPAIYVALERKSGTSALRIDPRLRPRVATLLADGVRFEGERFHSGMTVFEIKVNRGERPNHFGLAFTFESVVALRGFLDRLLISA